MNRSSVFLIYILILHTLTGCSNSGSSGSAGPSGVEIYSITAVPSVVRPGASADLRVSAGDGVNSALTYSWQVDAGSLNSTSSSSVTWTAPAAVGSYMVSVEVTNAAGLKARGYASILVSVSPAGPIITSVNPAEAKAGDQIRIIGAGFGSTQGTSVVSIGSAAALSIISWSETVITAAVPGTATSGSAFVTVGGVNSNPGKLVVLWAKENPENVALSIAAGDQQSPQIVSDGSGGAIITWESRITPSAPRDIYAQRVNSVGEVQWAANGVAICTAGDDQQAPQLVSDGAGGAIMVWMDSRTIATTGTDIYAQRINNAGVVQWTVNGVPVSTAASMQWNPQLISDDSGGAIITWMDARNPSNGWDIYAQRINSAGAVQWTADGVAISLAADTQNFPQIISDGAGGAIITWQDYRNVMTTNLDIYAQRVNSAGVVQWTTDGVPICTAAAVQQSPQLASDDSGGAIIAWVDSRNSATTLSDIYAQRVNNAGAVQWTANGVAISVVQDIQTSPSLIADGSGGAIIAWQDQRSGTNYDIYAQRVNSAGQVQWIANGAAMALSLADHFNPQIISDGAGGAIITWNDWGSGTSEIYAQRVSSAGAAQWAAAGNIICTAAGDQLNPKITSDGSGGAIITWTDLRSGNSDIYVQGISASGRQ